MRGSSPGGAAPASLARSPNSGFRAMNPWYELLKSPLPFFLPPPTVSLRSKQTLVGSRRPAIVNYRNRAGLLTIRSANRRPSRAGDRATGGICRASQAVEMLPALCPEIVVRDARLEDCWEVADTHCGSFFPGYKFPLDLVLRIDRYIALLSGFTVPPGCVRTCLVAVNSNSVNSSFDNVECGDAGDDAGFQKCGLSRGSIAGILTVDTVAEYLPRRGPLKQRRYTPYLVTETYKLNFL
ncbi:hypothetical protein BAE44_0022254 [Dichanthelium oligosanthes]|uniref:Uncharacterized protein n=1 Tax=Dichanthelium oligosanthes TaxID=888268 RepID=A0A1E5UV80_9POAL|nr:hypothetical protein BAE44_0022254 [Dichanthelium oligosanthes]